MDKDKITTGAALLLCGAMLFGATPTLAQEMADRPAGMADRIRQCCEGCVGKEQHGRGTEEPPKIRGHRHKRHHRQLAKRHQAMLQDLQQQLTVLRKHSQQLDRITDEQQMLEEITRHLRLTDALLETMVEQREAMHAMLKKRWKHKWRTKKEEGRETSPQVEQEAQLPGADGGSCCQ